MSLLAIRNLFHDRVRLMVTLTGIVFAIVLIVVQLGLFLGFVHTISGVIDHSGVDIWICSRGVSFLEHAVPFSERKLYQALATPGVVDGQKLILQNINWKRPDGAVLPVLIVGFDPPSGLGKPWNITTGDLRDVTAADTVWVDRLYQRKLGVSEIGDTIEINNRRARIAGFTTAIRSFTTAPYIFTSMHNATRYTELGDDKAHYLVLKTAEGAVIEAVKAELKRRLETVDVYTTQEFSRKTQAYWLLSTGAGFTILLAALLGLVVGVVVVSQTIYASTVDHLREYGTLKAIGASNFYLCVVIIKQATLSALVGYTLGMSVSYVLAYAARNGEAAIVVPWQMAVSMFLLTLAMCIFASLVSIRKVTSIDPAVVFK